MNMLMLYMVLWVAGVNESEQEPIDIGTRRELFVDDYLIERLENAQRILHHPISRDIALARSKSWEGNVSGYTSVFQDGHIYRMYYRGTHTIYTQGKVTSPHRELVCYTESQDGIHWVRPELKLVEFDGSLENNIIWDGVGSHNFTPFRDTNPACKLEEKYKALGSGDGGL